MAKELLLQHKVESFETDSGEQQEYDVFFIEIPIDGVVESLKLKAETAIQKAILLKRLHLGELLIVNCEERKYTPRKSKKQKKYYPLWVNVVVNDINREFRLYVNNGTKNTAFELDLIREYFGI